LQKPLKIGGFAMLHHYYAHRGLKKQQLFFSILHLKVSMLITPNNETTEKTRTCKEGMPIMISNKKPVRNICAPLPMSGSNDTSKN